MRHRKYTSHVKYYILKSLVAIRTSFEVNLADFGIKGFDGVVGSKVGESIGVAVSLMASNVDPGATADGGCDPTGRCLALSQTTGSGPETIAFDAIRGQTYYIIVDAPSGASSYDIDLSCQKGAN